MRKIKRINWIDWAKVITIFLVVLGHTDFNDVNQVPIFIYSFHMPLFFLLSGFLYKQRGSLKELITGDIKSLLVPYVLLNLVAFIILLPYYLQSDTYLPMLLYYFVLGVGHAPAGPCWFLLCLFFVRIISYLIFKLPSVWYQIIATTFVVLVYYILNVQYINLEFKINTALMATPFFIAGFYMKKYKVTELVTTKIGDLSIFIVSFLILVFTSQFNGWVGMHGASYGRFILLFYINAMIGICMIISLCKLFDNVESQIVKTISAGTLVILAFHIEMPKAIYHIAYSLVGYFEPNVYSNIIVSLLIMCLLYYPIIWVQKHAPILIGNRKILP